MNQKQTKTVIILDIYTKMHMRLNAQAGKDGATTILLAFAMILTGCQQKTLNTEQAPAEPRNLPISLCTDKPFRCKVGGTMKDGWYFIVAADTVEPTYAITVQDGAVTGDSSEDEYGCMGGGCDEIMFSKAGRNTYKKLNDKQVARSTPDGQEHVLSWYKPID